MPHATTEIIGQKRKANDEAEIEINLNAPEPASKKALRKAKKSKTTFNQEANKVTNSEDAGNSTTLTNNQQGGRSQSGIWIGNLPYSTTKDSLRTFLTSDNSHKIMSENISRIHLPTSTPKHGKPQNKGFAYVDFTGVGDLDNALQLSEKLFLGRRVLIKNAKSFEGRPASSDPKKKVNSERPPNSRIFVGNLGFDTTVQDLETHFQVCGEVENIHMATFEDSGKCKGFAWVEFARLASAEAAIRGWVEINDPNDTGNRTDAKKRKWVGKIEGRKLRMEYAEDRTSRYNKRFGKESRSSEDVASTTENMESRNDGNDESKVSKRVDNSAQPNAKAHNSSWSGSGSSKRGDGHRTGDSSGYARETVERIRGSIVPGEGKKVTFD